MSGGSTDPVCKDLVQIGEIAWEEFEKVGLPHFVNLPIRTEAKMGMACTMRLSTILSIHKISKMKKLLFQTPPWRFD